MCTYVHLSLSLCIYTYIHMFSRDTVYFPSELCSRRSVMFTEVTEVARLVPPDLALTMMTTQQIALTPRKQIPKFLPKSFP